jgi:two-component system cell cycle response regulator
MRNPDRVREILKGSEQLPTLPGIAVRILEAIREDKISLTALAEILSTDPPLSGKILKMVNSPFFGLRAKITSVPHAVNLLGINTVKNMALGFSLVKSFSVGNKHSFDYPLFWKNALVSAITSKLMAHEFLPDLEEDAFFLGLLHDIGILALVQCIPDQYCLVLEETERSLCSYHEAESQVLGFDHMEVGEKLIKGWSLPESFSIPVRYHHFPEDLRTDSAEIHRLAQILHLSCLFSDLFNLPDKGLYLGLVEWYAKAYGLFDRLDPDDMVQQTQQLTAAVFPLFDMKMDEGMDYVEMIERARSELISISSEFIQKFLDQQRQIETLREQATSDGLTKLNNFQRFHELLNGELHRVRRYGTPFSLIMGDIDDFKRINDTHGHLAGDHVLQAVAGCLRNTLRASDMIARYGGEEFAVIVTETGLEGALAAGERLRKNISSLTVHYEGLEIGVTMSFGIAAMDSSQRMCKKDLIKRADAALYSAKRTGKNRCCVHNEHSG